MMPITLEVIRSVLGWCMVMNFGVLLVWFLFFVLVKGWVYRMHTQWFKVSEERFNVIHYQAIAYFKLAIIFFNVVPYLALKIVV